MDPSTGRWAPTIIDINGSVPSSLLARYIYDTDNSNIVRIGIITIGRP